MLLDTVLAILHHVLILLLAAVLAAEFVLARPGLSGRDLRILGHIDGAYGGLAIGVLAVGALRVWLGANGWEFYVFGWMFWAKIAAFVLVGLLSIPPTLRIAAWNRAARSAAGTHVVPDAEIAPVRRAIIRQAAVFALIPVFAALMARGIGM